jgi:hypothetical protein
MLSHKLTMLIHLFSGGFQNSKTRIAADNDERGTWLWCISDDDRSWDLAMAVSNRCWVYMVFIN